MDCNHNGCGACCGTKGGCNMGCGGDIRLTEEELSFLQRFRALPFLPIARDFDGESPVFMDKGERISETLMWLKLKGLISLDYDMPLTNFDYAEYEKYPVRGSMALTLRGQAALDSLDVQGAAE